MNKQSCFPMKVMNNIIELYTQFGFIQRHKPLFRQANYALQFLWIFTFKSSLFSAEFNLSIHNTSNSIVNFFLTIPFLTLLNTTIFIPVFFFIIWNILQIIQNSPYQLNPSWLTPLYYKNLTIQTMWIFQVITVPCMLTDIRWIYFVYTDPANHLNIGLLVFVIIAFCLACTGIFLDSYGMLLNYVTVPVLLCLVGVEWNIIVLKVASLLMLFSQLEFIGQFGVSTNRVATVFKFLLVFVCALDIFLSNISNTFFLMYVFVIVTLPITSPEPEFITDNIQFNTFILNFLDKLKKETILTKAEQFKIIKQVLRYQNNKKTAEGATQHQKQSFQLSNSINYKKLQQFLKIKLSEDMEKHKTDPIYKLQHYLFEVKHNNMTQGILMQITEFQEQTKNNNKIIPKILLLEVKYEIDKNFKKKNESFSALNVQDTCHRIDIANDNLRFILNELLNFWTSLQRQELSYVQMSSILSQIESKEEQLQKEIKYLEQFPHLRTQVHLYNYSLKISNFDYEYQVITKSQTANNDTISNTYYIIMSQNKIVKVSNQMLLELKKKKAQVLDRSLEALIPFEIVNFIESKFMESFEKGIPEVRILPLVNINNQLSAYRVELSTTFSIESGVQQVVSFVKRHLNQQLPMFLYEVSTDKIKFVNKLFKTYLASHNRKMDSSTMGFDLFGYEISLNMSRSDVKINETQLCTLLKQKQTHQNLMIHLKVIEIYHHESSKWMLLAIESNDNIQDLAESTLFSVESFVKKKDNEDISHSMPYCRRTKKILYATDTYCPIVNPFQTHIDQCLVKIKIQCRMTCLTLACLLNIVLIVAIAVSVGFIWISTNKMSVQVNKTFDLSMKRRQAIEGSYQLFYLYYRYYQIRNYPEQVLSIRDFNMTYLNSQYYNLTDNNITIIFDSNFKTLPMSKKTYNMQFNSYNLTRVTSPESIIDFLSDIKQALHSNDPHLSVRNQHNLETIVSAFDEINTNYLDDCRTSIVYTITGMVLAMIVIAVILKIVAYKIQQMSQAVVDLYQNMPKDVIRKQLKRLHELNIVTQYSDPSLQKKIDFLDNVKIPLKNIQNNNKKNEEQKIRRRTFIGFLMTNNLVLIYCLFQLVFIFWNQMLLSNYQQNINSALKKYSFFLKSQLSVTIPSQKFYQAAMEQILPTNQRTASFKADIEYIYTDYIQVALPSYFQDYQLEENQMLESSLCQFAYLNINQFYRGMNCSAVLSGIMERSFAEAYSQYISLARNYTGTEMKNLGTLYRIGAQYPVFLEICYVRRNLNVIFTYLRKQFQKRIPDFINNQNESVLSVILNGMLFFPLFLTLIIIEYKKLRDEAFATIRAFKMIPKEYLLKMKVTKCIKSQGILQKLESF